MKISYILYLLYILAFDSMSLKPFDIFFISLFVNTTVASVNVEAVEHIVHADEPFYLEIHFSVVSNGYQANGVAKILLDPSIDHTRVCHVQPIVDVDDINFSDLKADDFGSWVTKGTKKPLSLDFSLMDRYVYLLERLLFKKDTILCLDQKVRNIWIVSANYH